MAAQLTVTIPWENNSQNYKDVMKSTQSTEVVANKQDITSAFNLANKYLWFALGVVGMGVLIVAGVKLVTARWDDKEMKIVNHLLIGLVVWVIIAIFSYLIVRVVANLF